MALKKSFEHCGVNVNNGYLKISEFSGNKTQIGFVLAFKANADADAIKHSQFNFVPNLEGQNFIAQAYEHLKTLPEFSGAIDC
jgi:hypothetical protein